MKDFFTVKHSFNAGDLIVLLPGLQNLYNETGKKTPEHLKQEALKKIAELQSPRHVFVEMQSSLELIMKRYEFDHEHSVSQN